MKLLSSLKQNAWLALPLIVPYVGYRALGFTDPRVFVVFQGIGILIAIYLYKPAATEHEPPKSTSPERNRRWTQFSLRTAMILTAVCAVGCAFLARKIERKRREREAVAAIVKHGGNVWYTYQASDHTVKAPWASQAEPSGPPILRELFGDDFFSEVEGAILNGAYAPKWKRVGYAELAHLGDLPHLRFLVLSFTGSTDADLENLKALTQLEALYLDENPITDTGLGALRGLDHIVQLDLHYTNVSDTGLANLRGLPLRDLDLHHTNVTETGIQDLQLALPNCKIRH